MKVTRRMREEAALILDIHASSTAPYLTSYETGLAIGALPESWKLAADTGWWVAGLSGRWCLTRRIEAESAQLLREGRTPPAWRTRR